MTSLTRQTGILPSQTIEALAKEKGIEPDVVISAIEEAVATASTVTTVLYSAPWGFT